MAESISEGTLKQWQRRKHSHSERTHPKIAGAKSSPEVGDYVEQDEEIATIETDKVRFF